MQVPLKITLRKALQDTAARDGHDTLFFSKSIPMHDTLERC